MTIYRGYTGGRKLLQIGRNIFTKNNLRKILLIYIEASPRNLKVFTTSRAT